MVWTPTEGYIPQSTEGGEQASGYVVKFYEPGTTTPLTMATDDTGGTTATNFLLDSEGYTTNAGARVVPHTSQSYKVILYLNQADADADATGSAVWSTDDINPSEPYAGLPSVNGQVFTSNTDGTRSWATAGVGTADGVVDGASLSAGKVLSLSRTESLSDVTVDISSVGIPSISYQTFTTSDTYTLPAGVLAIEVTCIGAGGGGAASDGSNGGAGGGSGAKGIKYIGSPDAAYAVVIGTAGAGGAIGNDGANGTASTFGSVCAGAGGIGGQIKIGGQGGAASSPSKGDITEGGFVGMIEGALNDGGPGGGAGANTNQTNATSNLGCGGTGADIGISAGFDGSSGIVIVKEYS